MLSISDLISYPLTKAVPFEGGNKPVKIELKEKFPDNNLKISN